MTKEKATKFEAAMAAAAKAEAAYQEAVTTAEAAEEALDALIQGMDSDDQGEIYGAGETAEDGVATESLDLKAARIDAWATAMETIGR